jgi:hypothetical protein
MRIWILAFGVPLWLSCSGQKQAQDPRQILGDEMHYGGVDGGSPSGETAAQEPSDLSLPATQGDCQAASEHLLLLGLQAEIDGAPDATKQAELRQQRDHAMESPRVKELIAEETRECLARGHTRAEAQCIARIESEQEIDGCLGE